MMMIVDAAAATTGRVQCRSTAGHGRHANTTGHTHTRRPSFQNEILSEILNVKKIKIE